MLYIPWMGILGDHNIKKQVSKTSTLELHRLKNCMSRLRTGPFSAGAVIGGNSPFASLARGLTGPQQGYKLQKTSFRILVGINCHNIPTDTP